MSKWAERLQDHPVRASLSELTQTLEGLESIDERDAESLDRLRRAASIAELQVSSTDPQRVTGPMLDGLQSGIRSVLAAIANQRHQEQQTGAAFQWPAIDADPIFDALARWPDLPPDDEVAGAWATLDRLPDEAARRLAEVAEASSQSIEGFRAAFADLQQVVSEWRDSVDEQVSGLSQRISDQVELIGQQLAILEGALGSYKSQFDNSQQQREQQNAETLSQIRDELTAQSEEARRERLQSVSDFKETKDRMIAELSDDGAALLAALEAKREEAVDIVGVIARTGMTAGYQQYADRERSDADRWRRGALWLSIVAVVVLAASVIVSGLEASVSTQVVVGRVFLSVALGGVAGYAGSQAGAHRKRAEKARSLELALLSIGPYLEALKGEDRGRILEAFAFLFFTPTKAEDEPEVPANMLGRVGDLMKLLGPNKPPEP